MTPPPALAAAYRAAAGAYVTAEARRWAAQIRLQGTCPAGDPARIRAAHAAVCAAAAALAAAGAALTAAEAALRATLPTKDLTHD